MVLPTREVLDREAFADLFARLRAPLYACAVAVTLDRAAAEHVIHRALEVAIARRDAFEPGEHSAEVWLYGIAHSVAVDERRRSRRRTSFSHPAGNGGAARLEHADGSDRAITLVQGLAPAERELIALRFWADLSHGEMAAVIGCSESKVGSRLCRAITKLRGGPVTLVERFHVPRVRMESLRAIDAALRQGQPSSDDPGVRVLQSFALAVRAAAPRPDEPFRERLDKRSAECEARAQRAKPGGERVDARRSTADAPFAIRVLVAEGRSHRRQAVITLLERDPGVEVVAEAAEGAGAIDIARRLRPDVVVVNLRLAGYGGMFVVERLCADLPDTRAIVLTADDTAERLPEALAAGAAGYLSQHTSGEELRDAVRTVHRGGLIIAPEFIADLLRDVSDGAEPQRSFVRPTLSLREAEILRLLAAGRTHDEIGRQLDMSPDIVQKHVARIRAKLRPCATAPPEGCWPA